MQILGLARYSRPTACRPLVTVYLLLSCCLPGWAQLSASSQPPPKFATPSVNLDNQNVTSTAPATITAPPPPREVVGKDAAGNSFGPPSLAVEPGPIASTPGKKPPATQAKKPASKS